MSSRKAAKPRAPPFSDLEIAILMSCLDRWKRIVESTETDACSVRIKKEAWDHVTDEFTELAQQHNILTPRTVDQLKTCWKNSKAKVRKIDSEVKTQAMLTGGGPEHKVSDADSSLAAMVHSIKPTLDFTLDNKWDSTGAFEDTVDLTQDESTKDDSYNFNDDEDFEMGNDSDNESEAACSQIMDKKKSEREAHRQNLLNEMNEREQALAKVKGFCKPASASFKIKQSASQSSSKTRTDGSSSPNSCATTAATMSNGKGATPKITTTQKLGQRMRNWEASLARANDEIDVKPSTSKAASPGILESRIKKCQENVDPDDDQLFRKKGKGLMAAAQAEQMERVKRAEDGRAQQAEFHQGRMEIIELEKAYWGFKIETALIEREKAASSANPATGSNP